MSRNIFSSSVFKGSGIEEEGPDYLIEEFRAVRKQFHERQSKPILQHFFASATNLACSYSFNVFADAKIKKYHQNLERESDDEEEKEEEEDDIDGDDDDDDRSDQETQYVCENCKCDRSHKEKDI